MRAGGQFGYGFARATNAFAVDPAHHEGFKRSLPPLINMDAAVKAKAEKLFNL